MSVVGRVDFVSIGPYQRDVVAFAGETEGESSVPYVMAWRWYRGNVEDVTAEHTVDTQAQNKEKFNHRVRIFE